MSTIWRIDRTVYDSCGNSEVTKTYFVESESEPKIQSPAMFVEYVASAIPIYPISALQAKINQEDGRRS